MPQKGKQRVSDEQREIIASVTASGKPRKAAAEAAGVSLPTVHREVSKPETRALIQRLRDSREPKLGKLYDTVIDTLVRDLEKEATPALREEAMRLLMIGEPRAPENIPGPKVQMGSSGFWTIDQLQVLAQRATPIAPIVNGAPEVNGHTEEG